MATVVMPGHLCRLYGAARQEHVGAADVASAIEELEQRFPGIGERLLEPGGTLRRWINVFVDGEDIRSRDGMATRLAGGAEMIIVPAVAGG